MSQLHASFHPQAQNFEHFSSIVSFNLPHRIGSVKMLEDGLQQMVDLLNDLPVTPAPAWQITVPTLDGFRVLKLSDMLRLESDSNYTRIYIHGEKPFMVSRTLKEFELLLNDKGFFRIHRRHIINLSLVQRYIKGKGSEVIMVDGSILQVSRTRKLEFLQHFIRK